jgi:hypothetical protein
VRILAKEDDTWVSINGGTPIGIDAGEWHELNGVGEALCISSTKPVAVNRYMEGMLCAGAGDPSQLGLMPLNSPIDHATFYATDHIQIEAHSITITTPLAGAGSISLDGIPLAASITPYPACADLGYVTVPIVAGAHQLVCPQGCQAQVQGFGIGQSYAFGLMPGTSTEQVVETGISSTVAATSVILYDSGSRMLNWPVQLGSAGLEVRDMAGNLVLTARTSGVAGMRLPAMSSGVYMVTVRGASGTTTGRFVVL